MKRIILPLLSLTVLSAFAAPIDLGSRARLRSYGYSSQAAPLLQTTSDGKRDPRAFRAKGETAPEYVNVFLSPAEGYTVSDLKNLDGVEILKTRGAISLGPAAKPRNFAGVERQALIFSHFNRNLFRL